MTITEVVSRLAKTTKKGRRFNALCPAHDDKSPSLSIMEGDHRIVFHCFAGCSEEAVLEAVGLEKADLFPDTVVSTIRSNGNGGAAAVACVPMTSKIDTVYSYRDAAGTIVYENIRYSPKSFRQRRPDGRGGYVYDLHGVDRVPYRLPELIAARQNGINEIWLTEGEKDADNLRSLGFTASSFKNWSRSFNSYLNGAHAVVFRDHDASGIKQANDAAKIISDCAASIKMIDVFDGEGFSDQHGHDVSDWIEARRSEGIDDTDIAEQLSVIVERCDLWESNTKNPVANGHFQFSFTTLDDLYNEPEEETAYVWDRTFPLGGFSIISAKPKVGKSTVLRNLAVAISRGDSFLGRETLRGKVLYLCLEEKRNEVRKHFQLMQAAGDSILIHSGSQPQKTTDTITGLRDAIAEFDPVIVFIDPLSRVIRAADFNDYQITYALEPFIDLARKTNVHISALHHDGKGNRDGGDEILGSTAIFGSVDCHLSMKKRQHGRTISSTQRYGEDLPETVIELDKTTGILIDKGDLQSTMLTEVKTEVLAALGPEWLKQSDIKERLPNRNAGLVSKAISSLVEEGILDRVGSGKKGDPYFYGIDTPDSLEC